MLSLEQQELLHRVKDSAKKLNYNVYLVGGVVRDLLISGSIKEGDLDFIVEGDASTLAEELALQLGGEVKTFKSFLTAKLVRPPLFKSIHEIDFATARKEIYRHPGSLPEVSPASISEDLGRRDFSINSIALPLEALERWLATPSVSTDNLAQASKDLFGGVDDLKTGTIRVLHAQSFLDDPTRMFRACRYAARLNGQIEPATAKLLQEALEAEALETISAARKMAELKKIFAEKSWVNAIQLMQKFSMLLKLGLTQSKGIPPEILRLEALHALNGDLRLTVFLATCFALLPIDLREKNFRALGFGKRKFSLYKNLLLQAREQQASDMSSEALSLAVAFSASESRQRKEDLEKEYRKRLLEAKD